MIRITIKGGPAGIDASEWCQANLNDEDWVLWMDLPNSWTTYHFEFSTEQAATLFALRWSEYA
jgi:hypothetical protein